MLANSSSTGSHAAAPAADALASGGRKGGSRGPSVLGRKSHAEAVAKEAKAAGSKGAGTPPALQTGFAALLKHARESLAKDRSPLSTTLNLHTGGTSGGSVAKGRDPGAQAHGPAPGGPGRLAASGSAEALLARHQVRQKDAAAAQKAAELPAPKAEDRKRKPEQPALPVAVVFLDLGTRGPTPLLKPSTKDGNEKTGPEQLERAASHSRHEVKLTLADMRHSVEGRRAEAESQAEKTAQGAKDELKIERPHASDRSELVREYGIDGNRGGSERGRPEAASGAAGGRDFQSLLAERLRDAWNGDIVKNAHIVLKDGDAGIIRLRLRPESLGNVKIELNLSDNNISGKIVVQSDEAKHAFERNMGELADAFRQGGFDSAKLEVSVGSGSRQGGQSPGQGGDSEGAFYSERLRRTEPTAALRGASWTPTRRGAVDILA